MHTVIRNAGPDGLEINVQGKLRNEDYSQFKELAKERIDRFGQVNVLVVITEFSGWTPAALCRDIKFDVAHQDGIRRLAIVGTVPLNHWMAALAKPFTSADVQYYSIDDIETARVWIRDLPLEQLALQA
ncbi:MAG: STAS/SEC14 domain-containing protein [Halioglobus sp.]|nr:STAS/SEC14 domain-containing protein [Halioglobus sp.]